MENSGKFRKKKTNFAMVSNTIARDKNITFKAKGLYLLIQSYITIDNFTLYKSFLQSQSCEGVRAFDSAWNELKKTGYLKQYKMRKGGKTFYYEYELLDEPEIETSDDGQSFIQNVGTMDVETFNVLHTKDGSYNNTIQNNTIHNNTISNHIISISDVKDMIGYDAFSLTNINLVDEVVLLITDILNIPDGRTIWIAKEPIQSEIVKARFLQLNKFHIDYVLECMNSNANKIANIKSYLLTALYNAPTTMNNYYLNKVAVMKGD